MSKGLVSFALNDRPAWPRDTRERILAAAARARLAPEPAGPLAVDPQAPSPSGWSSPRPAGAARRRPVLPRVHRRRGDRARRARPGPGAELVRDAAAEAAGYRALAADGRVDGVLLTDLRRDDDRLALLAAARAAGGHRSAGPTPGRRSPPSASTTPPGSRDVGRAPGRARTPPDRLRRPATAVMLHGRAAAPRFAPRRSPGTGWRPRAVVDTDFTPGGGRAATPRAARRAEPPTAVVYANDPMAMAGLAVAQRRGLRVPGRPLGDRLRRHRARRRTLHPALTTVGADPLAWGAAAAATLLLRLLDRRAGRRRSTCRRPLCSSAPRPTAPTRRPTGPHPHRPDRTTRTPTHRSTAPPTRRSRAPTHRTSSERWPPPRRPRARPRRLRRRRWRRLGSEAHDRGNGPDHHLVLQQPAGGGLGQGDGRGLERRAPRRAGHRPGDPGRQEHPRRSSAPPSPPAPRPA